MKDLRLFATAVCPLHPSGLMTLVTCPWRAAMEYLSFGEEGESGPAADTGSATHAGVAAFHRGRGVAAAMQEMREKLKDYPRADLTEAAAMFLAYATDPRNSAARIVCVEEPIAFNIAPATEDPTQAPIEVIGTMDQVREVDGQLYLHDVKTSKRDPVELLNHHVFQFAAYCIGGSIKLGRQVNPGSLILTRKYGRDVATSPVFWHYPWKFKDIEQILASVRHAVARIRSSDLYHVPNNDCRWCRMKTPDLCLPRLQEVLRFREQHAKT